MSFGSLAGAVGGKLLSSALKEDTLANKIAHSVGKKIIQTVGEKFGASKSFQTFLEKQLQGHLCGTHGKSKATTSAEKAEKTEKTDPAAAALLSQLAQYGEISGASANAALLAFDQNGDSQITRQELTAGQEQLGTQITDLKAKPELSADDRRQLTEAQRAYQFAGGVLNHFDPVARLSGDAATLDAGDFTALAARDTQTETIGIKDWQFLLA